MHGGITGSLCYWGIQIRRPGPPGCELDVRLMILLFEKKNTVVKSKEVKLDDLNHNIIDKSGRFF